MLARKPGDSQEDYAEQICNTMFRAVAKSSVSKAQSTLCLFYEFAWGICHIKGHPKL